jgi:hypothetical protein
MCPRPRVFRDLPRQFSGIRRLPAMLRPGKTSGPPRSAPAPDPRPAGERRRKAGRRIDRPHAFGHLEPERPDDTVDNPERSSKTGHLLQVM